MSSSPGNTPRRLPRFILAAVLVAVPVVLSSILLLFAPTQLNLLQQNVLASLVAYIPGLSSISWLSSLNHLTPHSSFSLNSQARQGAVARVRWSQDKPYADYLRSLNKPVVLINTYESAAVPRYTVDNVAAEILAHQKRISRAGGAKEDAVISGLFKHSSPIFGPYYDKGRPMHRLKRVQAGARYDVNASLPASDIGRVFRSAGPPFYALSTDPSQLHLAGVDLRAMLAVRSNRSSVNVWLGMRGGTTPCHFDGYHNMYDLSHEICILILHNIWNVLCLGICNYRERRHFIYFRQVSASCFYS
jgi:hypothetical protein